MSPSGVSTDQTHPSWSAHEITLNVRNAAPLIIQVPWPFLAQEYDLSLFQLKKKKKGLHLILKKSLNDPLPKEFGGRSKWDVDLLKPWKDLKSNGSLKSHIEAQFDCNYLRHSIYSKKESNQTHQGRCNNTGRGA